MSDNDMPDLPDFLHIPQAKRDAAWKGRKLTIQGSAFKTAPTRAEEAETKKLRKEIETAAEHKRQERFKALREARQERKR